MYKKCVLDDLARRRDEIREWLRAEAPQTALEQAHLEEGSSEQAYWSHGYQSAIDDVIRFLNAPQASNNGGRTSH